MGALGAVLGIFGALWSELLAKLGRRWAQDDRSWVQDGVKSRPRWTMIVAKRGRDSAKMGHDSAKMSILTSTWELLGQFWEQFWRILGDGLESEKQQKTL